MAKIGHGIRDYLVRCAALSRRLPRPDARGFRAQGLYRDNGNKMETTRS